MNSTSVVFAVALWSTSVAAQQYTISTFAGGAVPPATSIAKDAFIGSPSGMVTDSSGNLYFASAVLNCIFRLDTSGMLTRVAGNSSSRVFGRWRARRGSAVVRSHSRGIRCLGESADRGQRQLSSP